MNLSQGYSSGGSVNSAQAFNNSGSVNQSWTDALSARQWSAYQADVAWQRDLEAMQMQMDYNREEAKRARDWQEQMANTIYTRSVKNMREAGINPILAANMGLSGASVGSGSTASIGGAPSAPLAQSFMDSWSAGESWGHGESQSHGSSWSESENGLVTALSALGNIVGNALASVTSGANINLAIDGLNKITEQNKEKLKKAEEAVRNKDYSSPDYPHEPGRQGSTQANMNILETITNFAENIINKTTDNKGAGHRF